jgi:hypothetical protein
VSRNQWNMVIPPGHLSLQDGPIVWIEGVTGYSWMSLLYLHQQSSTPLLYINQRAKGSDPQLLWQADALPKLLKWGPPPKSSAVNIFPIEA